MNCVARLFESLENCYFRETVFIGQRLFVGLIAYSIISHKKMENVYDETNLYFLNLIKFL